MKKIHAGLRLAVIVIALSPMQFVAAAENIDLTWPLQARNLLVQAKQATKVWFRDREVQYHLRLWLNAEVNRAYVQECERQLGVYFHSRNVLGALCWAKRQNRTTQIKWLLTHYYLDLAVSLLELSHDPRYEKKFQRLAARYLPHFRAYEGELKKLASCFSRRAFTDIATCLAQNFTSVRHPRHHIYNQLSGAVQYEKEPRPYFSLNTAQTFPFHAGHAASETGWIAGSRARYVTTARTDIHFGQALQANSELLEKHYPFSAGGRGSLPAMYDAIKQKGYRAVFNEDGFKLIDSGDPQRRDLVWSQPHGVYHEALKLIDSAEETIFIDMFAFGGVMGVSLAKHLIKRLHTNKKLKIFILRDIVNHFGAIAELMPVFNYLLAWSYLFPQRLIVSAAYIHGHTSGLPTFMRQVIDDNFVKASGIQAMLDLAVQAVSDHSKLMVVDAKSSHPRALVSSKNWSDRTGAYFYDDAVVVEGAAAAVVQDDFYHDMRLGLKYVMAQQFKAGVLGEKSYIDRLYGGTQRQASLDVKISAILHDFDLLERDAQLVPQRQRRLSWPALSHNNGTLIRTGFNSVDSSTTNIIDQNIQAILHAKKNIYINEQFCFDSKVVTALLNVKSKRPQLDIKIILEHALESEPDGIPNLLYLDLLINRGIELRWKKTQWIGNIPQKNHSKTLSVDGKFVIVGSANKDGMTMFGSFRDQQLDIFDTSTAAAHDAVFLRWWHNVEPLTDYPHSRDQFEPYSYMTEYVQPYTFLVPDFFVDFEGNPLPAKDFLRVGRGLIKLLYDYIVL